MISWSVTEDALTLHSNDIVSINLAELAKHLTPHLKKLGMGAGGYAPQPGIDIGSGDAPRDVELYRDGADGLRTPDTFRVGELKEE